MSHIFSWTPEVLALLTPRGDPSPLSPVAADIWVEHGAEANPAANGCRPVRLETYVRCCFSHGCRRGPQDGARLADFGAILGLRLALMGVGLSFC